jgi:hypothetical protein
VEKPTIDFRKIDRGGSLTLVVGWKSGLKMRLRQLTITGAVEDAFRAVVSTTLDNLSNREAVDWSPEADLSPETYLVISKSDLGESPTLAS